ncbi:MAG: ATP-binding protein [Fervidicoccaceae archaeon]
MDFAFQEANGLSHPEKILSYFICVIKMLLEIFPRLKGTKLNINILGPSFTFCIMKDSAKLHILLDTSTSPNTLRAYFESRQFSYDNFLEALGRSVYASEARLKREEDFWLGNFSISDLPGTMDSLDYPSAVCLSISRSLELSRIFLKHSAGLIKRASKNGDYFLRSQAEIFRNIMNRVLLLKLVLLAGGREDIRKIEKLIDSLSIAKLSWMRHIVNTSQEISELLKPPTISLFETLIGKTRKITVLEENLREMIFLPDPSIYRIDFSRGSPLPLLSAERVGKRAFRIGLLENGKEFRLSVEDLYRHTYIIGRTGSGKTSFMKLLVHRMNDLGDLSLIVVDPHGDMAKELAEEAANSKYFHPINSPFGINPLDLPNMNSREHAVSIAVDVALEIFRDVLRLTESAVNVKYMLQVILRILYEKNDSPTLAQLYDMILDLHEGKMERITSDEKWEKQLRVLQRMQSQSFISALSRLEPFAHDKLLLRITSRTTVDFSELMQPGSLALFSVPKADLGEHLAKLIASAIIMKLWFQILARARSDEKRTPVFLVVDEFQFIADFPIIDTILSEARKFGLHLVMAHQHTGQISRELFQSIMTNCAVKVSFAVEGEDVARLSTMDAAFSEAIERSLGSLTVGKGIVKITGNSGEQQPPPAIVTFDYIEK